MDKAAVSRVAHTTDMNDLPMARNTLLFASSEWSITCGGGKGGSVPWGSGEELGSAALSLDGTGRILRGAREGPGDCLKRAEGRITEFWRIRVP